MNNTIRTVFLLGILSLIVIWLGGLIGGQNGTIMAFVIAVVMNGIGYFFSDKIALSASGAKPLSRRDAPELFSIVEDLSQRMRLPLPAVFITPEQQANAFATGRNPSHASIAVTRGLLSTLTADEIRGVLAHELSHVKNRDILITSVAAVLASSISFLARMGYWGGFGSPRNDRDREGSGALGFLLVLLAPVAAILLQLAVSRQREYAADLSGAETLGTGGPLADALADIGNSAKQLPMENLNPAFSSLYIANPLGGWGGTIMNLFSTHPPLAERIKRLRAMKP